MDDSNFTLVLDSEPQIEWDSTGNLYIKYIGDTDIIYGVITIPVYMENHKKRSHKDISHSIIDLTTFGQRLRNQETTMVSDAPLEIKRLSLNILDPQGYYLYLNNENRLILQSNHTKDHIYIKFPQSLNIRMAEWLDFLKTQLEQIKQTEKVSRCIIS